MQFSHARETVRAMTTANAEAIVATKPPADGKPTPELPAIVLDADA